MRTLVVFFLSKGKFSKREKGGREIDSWMHSLSNRQTIGQTCLSCAAVEGATRPSLYSVYSEYKYGVGSNPCFLCIFRHFINMQITWMLSSNFGLCILRLFIFSYFYTFSPVMIVLIVQFLIYCHMIYVLSWTIVNSIYNYFPWSGGDIWQWYLELPYLLLRCPLPVVFHLRGK